MKIKSLKPALKLFLPYLFANNKNKIRCGIVFLLLAIDILVASYLPFLSKKLVEYANNPISTGIVSLITLASILWLLDRTISYIQDIIFFPIINNAIKDISYKVIDHIHQIPLTSYQELSIPEIISSMKRISMSARYFLKIIFLSLLPTLIKLIIAITIIIKLEILGIGLVFGLAIAIAIFYLSILWYIKLREQSWIITDQVIVAINDSILNTKLARFFKSFELGKLDKLLNKEMSFWYKTNTRLNIVQILIGIIFCILTVIIISYGLLMVREGELSVGNFVLLQGQIATVLLPFKSLSGEFRQIAEYSIDIKKIISIFSIPKSKVKTKKEFDLTKPVIEISNLNYKNILSNVNLTINEGEKIALIGESGAGKSTLVNLLSTFFSASNGNIKIYGQNIEDIDPENLAEILYTIPQDVQYFNQTLLYNLTYGSDSYLDQDLDEIIKNVGLTALIKSLPQGVNTYVGEMGLKLSGGERQRVALVRALLAKPKILILDETTNSLDFESEAQVISYINAKIPTLINISHRGNNLSQFDKIYKVEKGSVVAV